MAIPEHVKKQAMDAVSHKETTAFIRMYRNNDADAPSFTHQDYPATRSGPIPDDVKKKAMDAIANKDTTEHIRLVKETGSAVPSATPLRESSRVAEMHRAGHNADAIHRSATKDSFDRDAYG